MLRSRTSKVWNKLASHVCFTNNYIPICVYFYYKYGRRNKSYKEERTDLSFLYCPNGAIQEIFLHLGSAEKLDEVGLTEKIIHVMESQSRSRIQKEPWLAKHLMGPL